MKRILAVIIALMAVPLCCGVAFVLDGDRFVSGAIVGFGIDIVCVIILGSLFLFLELWHSK